MQEESSLPKGPGSELVPPAMYTVVHPFYAVTGREISVLKGERLLLLEKRTRGWISVQSVTTGMKGCVPISKLEQSQNCVRVSKRNLSQINASDWHIVLHVYF